MMVFKVLSLQTTRKKTMKYKDCRGLKGSFFLWLPSASIDVRSILCWTYPFLISFYYQSSLLSFPQEEGTQNCTDLSSSLDCFCHMAQHWSWEAPGLHLTYFKTKNTLGQRDQMDVAHCPSFFWGRFLSVKYKKQKLISALVPPCVSVKGHEDCCFCSHFKVNCILHKALKPIIDAFSRWLLHMTNNNGDGSRYEPDKIFELTWPSVTKLPWSTQKALC